MYAPLVARIERTALEEVVLLGLGQHEQIRSEGSQLGRGLLPELDRHEHGHVAAETVDAVMLDPEAHGVDLPAPHVAVGVVELGRIGPVPRHARRTVLVALVPVGRLLLDPPRIACGVVGDPVQNHLHAQRMRPSDERIEIGHVAHFGVDGRIVRYRIVRAEGAFAPLDADRIYRHQPYDVDPQIMQELQPAGSCGERTLGRKLTHVHLVKHGRITPLRVYHTITFYAKIRFLSTPDNRPVPTRGRLSA